MTHGERPEAREQRSKEAEEHGQEACGSEIHGGCLDQPAPRGHFLEAQQASLRTWRDVPIDDRRLAYNLSVVAALVVFIGFTVPLMQDGAIDALNATSAP